MGDEGALRILPLVTRQIHRLDISHNLLGLDGVETLFKGLSVLRSRYSSPEAVWGLSEINLGCNGIDDEALDRVMAYAKKDVCLRKVYLQANDIELRHNLPSILHSLSSSTLTTLSLTNNKSMLPDSLTTLLDTLHAPALAELYLSACDLGPSIIPSLARYLSSPRSRNLALLELHGNSLGAACVRRILDTIETSNFTLRQLGLLANDAKSQSQSEREALGSPSSDTSTPAGSCSAQQAESRILSDEVHDRLPRLLLRNRQLTRRTQQSALRVLAPGRVILHAQPASAETTAARVLEAPERIPFPLLDLPEEVVWLVVRHTSGDVGALGQSQWARMRQYLLDRPSLGRMADVVRSAERGARRAEEVRGRVRDVKMAWLCRGKWDKWELDSPPLLDPAASVDIPEDDGASPISTTSSHSLL